MSEVEYVRVYKFYSQRWGLEALDRKRLKISEIDKLNDPFEYKAVNIGDKINRPWFAELFKNISADNGIISFSGKWSNPVIWSHYADSHQGMALGFDIPIELATEILYTSELLEPSQILDLSDLERERFIERVLCTKFDHWKYENEFRLQYSLGNRDVASGLYFKDFDERLILKEIVFGAKYKSRGAKQWQLDLTKSGVSFTTTRMAFKSFSIVNQEAPQLQTTL